MASKKHRPQWWQIYAMLPALAGAFLLEMRLRLTSTENVVAQLAIVFLVFGFIQRWIHANQRALMGLDEESGEWQFKVYEFPPAAKPEQAGERPEEKPIFRLPESGLKGVLSTTFEMDEFEDETAFPAGSDIFYSEEIFNARDTKDSEA